MISLLLIVLNLVRQERVHTPYKCSEMNIKWNNPLVNFHVETFLVCHNDVFHALYTTIVICVIYIFKWKKHNMPLTSISLAFSCQENAIFPWLPNKTAKKVLNLLGVLDNPAKKMLVFLGGHHRLPRNIESLAVN